MKKRICYFLLIVIAIVGSRVLYGMNFDLNMDTLVDDNLYKYDIIGNKDLLDTYIDGDYLYYLIGDIKKEKDNNDLEYSFIKYDLSNNQKELEYNFLNKDTLYPVKIIKKNNYFYLTSMYNNIYYKFNNKLELIEEVKEETDNQTLYGLYNNSIFTIKENEIYYKNKLYDTLPNTCGINSEIIYKDNTYLKFYNYNKDLGCLYNLDDKSIYYLDYSLIDISYSKYIEYQNNSIKFRYNNSNYYFNDITETNNLKMHSNGDYLFTYDSTNNYLRIYNLDTRRVIYEKKVSFLKDSYISDVNIGDYAYFTVYQDNYKYLYFWDYLKSGTVNKEMISNNEKEYKFKNDKLISEIKEKYDINVYIYDQAVRLFDDIYVIPSYDDILINTRLTSLINILEEYNDLYYDIENFKSFNIYFEKEISNTSIYSFYDNDRYNIVINIVDDGFKDNMLYELMNTLQNNQADYFEDINLD